MQAAFQLGELSPQQAPVRLVPVSVWHVRRLPSGADRGGAGRVGRVGHVGHHLQRRPQAAGSRHLHRVPAEVQQILAVGRIEHRNGQVGQRELGRARTRRRLGARIVTNQSDRTTVRVRAGHVRVAQRVAGPVEARSLAVPDPDDPVRPRPAEPRGELAAHDGRRRQLFVQRRPVHDAVAAQQRILPCQLQVETGQWRALVARDEGGRLPSRTPVMTGLVHQHPHQCLHPGEVDRAVFTLVAMLQGEAGRRSAVVHVLLLLRQDRIRPLTRDGGEGCIWTGIDAGTRAVDIGRRLCGNIASRA